VLAVLGENIVDLVPDEGLSGEATGGGAPARVAVPAGEDVPAYRAHLGGGPANAAVAAARLGSPTALLARVSRDGFGQRIRDRLARAGVDGRYLVPAREPSSLAVVSFDAARRPSYDFWLAGTADWQWSEQELPDPLDDDVRALHVGSLAAFLEPGASAVDRFVRAEGLRGRVTLSFDPNLRPAILVDADGSLDVARQRVERLVGLVDVVKVSDEDLGWLYPEVEPDKAAAVWAAHGPALVVVTHGAEGAVAISRAATVAVPAPVVDVVDTVGAGDTFSGALLHGLDTAGLLGPGGAERIAALDADGLTRLLTTAVTAAALTCTRAGPTAPTAADLAAALD